MSTFHNTVALRMVGRREDGDDAVLFEEDLGCALEFSTIVNSKEWDATKPADNIFIDEFGPPFRIVDPFCASFRPLGTEIYTPLCRLAYEPYRGRIF